MNTTRIATRILAGTLPAMALLATPALAQDAAQPAAPVIEAAPMPPTAPPPSPATNGGASDSDRAKYEASVTAATGNADVSAQAEAATPRRPAARPAARPATRAVQPRVQPRAEQRRAAPAPVRAPAAAAVAAAPAPAVTPAPVPSPTATAPAATDTTPVTTATPLPDAPMTTPVPEASTPATTTETSTNTTTETPNGLPTWVWVLGGLLVLGLAAFALLRRGRKEEVWDEPTAVQPVYEEPVAAAPLAAAAPIAAREPIVEQAEVVDPAADEVAAIAEASAPVAGRPWIELSLRPIRAGATDESATVDLELTLANTGEVEARDVRVTTFMLGDVTGAATAIDGLRATGHGGAEVAAGEIGAGEGSRVDATLAVPRDTIEGPTFQPVVVADVRYTLPGGGEGRTAAAFAIGVDDGIETLTPLRLGGDFREDIAATLHGAPERA